MFQKYTLSIYLIIYYKRKGTLILNEAEKRTFLTMSEKSITKSKFYIKINNTA